MEPITTFLLAAPWQAIGAGVVAFSSGAVTLWSNGSTLWGNLQRLRGKHEPTWMTRLVGTAKDHGDVLKLLEELERDARPLAVALMRRQFMLYIGAGLLCVVGLGIVSVVLTTALSRLLPNGWTFVAIVASAIVGWGGLKLLRNPNELFHRAADASRELYGRVFGELFSSSRADLPSLDMTDLPRILQQFRSAAATTWGSLEERIYTTEERRLVEQFVLTDTLVRNLWAHALTQKIVQIRVKLAPALREAVGDALAGAIVRKRVDFHQISPAEPRTDLWRERNRLALTKVFNDIGLGAEFTDGLGHGFLDNDFFALADEPKKLRELLAQHWMFRAD